MTQLTAIRKAANSRIHVYNQLVRSQQSRGIELQTECALEVLAELADDLGALGMYQQITNRIHKLEQHRVLAPITAMGVQLFSDINETRLVQLVAAARLTEYNSNSHKEWVLRARESRFDGNKKRAANYLHRAAGRRQAYRVASLAVTGIKARLLGVEA